MPSSKDNGDTGTPNAHRDPSREIRLVPPPTAVILRAPKDPLRSAASEPVVQIPAVAPPPKGSEGEVSTRRSLDGPKLQRTPHPRATLHRWGLLGWLLGKLFFSRVFFPKEAVERIREASREGTVVYVMRLRCTLNFLYFNFAFLAHGLPLARFANGLRAAFYQPLKLLLRQLWRKLFGPPLTDPVEVLRSLTEDQRSSAVFLRSQAHFGAGDFEGPYLQTLVELQRESERPIILVPLTVLWGMHNVRDAPARFNLLAPLLGNYDEPRPLRRWFQVLRYAHRSLAVACEPLRLDTFLASRQADEATKAASEALEAELLERIEAERRVRIGPRRAHFLQIRRRILQRPEVRALLIERANASGKSVPQQERRAERELKRMQAQMSSRGLGRLKWIIDQIWHRLYEGFELDEKGLATLPDTGRAGPLVFVPAHRSHVDYLVLSDLLVSRKLLPPHIAAGINLSFWPLGWLFRTGGAFFLRRRAHGDALYSALLRAYVAELLKEGHNLEVFIEGGRSRTGRVLHPKLGLLAVVCDLAVTDEIPPVHVVPVSIGYERLIELGSVTRELTGGAKRPESIGGIVRAARVLRSQQAYGHVNVQFAEPIEVKGFLSQRGYDSDSAHPELRRKAIRSIGFHTLARASEATSVTPSALVAAAMLAPGTRGIPRKLLLQAIELFGVVAKSSGARFVSALWEQDDRVLDDANVDRAIELLARDRALVLMGSAEERIYVSEDQARIRLEYYKNLMSQHLIGPAVVAIVVRAIDGHRIGVLERSRIETACVFVIGLLRLHFVANAGQEPEAIAKRWLDQMLELKLLAEVEPGRVQVREKALASLELLAGVLESTVEAYSATARGLLDLRSGARPRKELERALLDRLNRRHLTGTLRRFESCQVPMVQTAIDWLCEEGILIQSGDNGDLRVDLARGHEDGRALEVLVERAELLLERPPV